jgi:hypothetical protein
MTVDRKFEWTKTDGCSLLTEVAKGYMNPDIDVGYIYKDGSKWTSVFIYTNGDDLDTSCSTKAMAKANIENEYKAEEDIRYYDDYLMYWGIDV